MEQEKINKYIENYYNTLSSLAKAQEERDLEAIRKRITGVNELNKTLELLYGYIPFRHFKRMLLEYQEQLKQYVIK